jgi:hypothetical protein
MSGPLHYADFELLGSVERLQRSPAHPLFTPSWPSWAWPSCPSEIEILVRRHLRILSKPKRGGEKGHALRACRGRA